MKICLDSPVAPELFSLLLCTLGFPGVYYNTCRDAATKLDTPFYTYTVACIYYVVVIKRFSRSRYICTNAASLLKFQYSFVVVNTYNEVYGCSKCLTALTLKT